MNKLLIFLILLFSGGILTAQSGEFSSMKNVDSFKKKLNDKAGSIQTIQSNFVQEKQLSFLNKPVTSEGKFFYREDNKVRWEYVKPFTYMIIIANEKLMIKDEDQVNKIDMASNKTFKEVNKMVMGSLQGKIIDDQNFIPAFFENQVLYQVKLSPKDDKMKEFIREIIVEVDKLSLEIKSVKIIELSGDYTRIQFAETQYNASISDQMFVLE